MFSLYTQGKNGQFYTEVDNQFNETWMDPCQVCLGQYFETLNDIVHCELAVEGGFATRNEQNAYLVSVP